MKSLLLAVSILALFPGCAEVKPWQRGDLSRSEMAASPDGQETQIKEHIFSSKEASSGGMSASGGGCGCN